MSKEKLDISERYKVSRYFTPSSITASRTGSGNELRARKRQMHQPFTYEVLLDTQARRVISEQLNEQTAANRQTALRGFMSANSIHPEDVVGDELRLSFPSALERYVATMLEAGRSDRSITNTKSALRVWKELVVERDTLEALNQGTNTPFVQMLKSLLTDIPVLRVSKQAGVPKDMLWGWLRGKLPRASSYKYLLRLEGFFGVERHSLVNISGIKPAGHKVSLGPAPTPIRYNEIIGELTQTPYCFKPPEDSTFRAQWTEFLRYKTAAVPRLRRTKHGRWRVSPCPLTPATAANWWAFLEGREIASARAAWFGTVGLLGWLGLPAEKGGKGVPQSELHTLAWLVVPDHVESYLDWKAERVGNRNRWFIQFLGFIASVVRPRFGYLRQRPELQATLPGKYQGESWDALCDRQFEMTELLVAAHYKDVVASRDSFAPIRSLIEMPQPMDAIVDMVRRMRADRPIGSPGHEDIWARDLVLIKLLSTVPLRRRNLAHLTWRPDNTGDLYQRADRSWWVRLPKGKFKNTYGAAGEEVYDCQIQPSAWRDIERYLFIHRPRLQRHPTDLIFLAKAKKGVNEVHRPWADLSKRVVELTARYIPSCSGFGAHAFRHIVATSILKASEGDYKTVAKILHDRVATVEKHYDGLRSNDASARMGQLLSTQFAQM